MNAISPRDPRDAILARLPAATIGTARACKLCDHPAHHFDNVDFNKSCNDSPLPRLGICVEYFRCQNCELLFTDFFDAWSHEDFSRYVYNDGYAAIDPEYASVRPVRSACELGPSLVGAEGLRILDYGSGTGVFATELEARGFTRVESFDPFSRPDRPAGRFDVITCMDVIEHSPDPRGLFGDILSLLDDGGILLVGQTLQPAEIGALRGNWWYIAPRNGHVTTYSCETMRLYADAHALDFWDFGDLFALTRPGRSAITDAIIARRRPQPRRIALAAPAPALGSHEAWHEAEAAPSGMFRWTREADVPFGTHPTPRGQFRVVFRHLGARDPAFLARSRIRVGTQSRAIEVHEDDLFAVFDLPFEAQRAIALETPVPCSDAAMGLGSDLRPVGLAIACAPDMPG